MNAPLVLTACALISAASSAAVAVALRPEAPILAGPSTEAASPPSGEIQALRAELEKLRQEQSLASTALASAQRTAAHSKAGDPSEILSADDVASLIRSLVEEDSLVQGEPTEKPWPGGAADARAAIDAILELGVDTAEARALWEEAAANGQLHELLAEMEARMELEPVTADQQYDRARAFYAAAQVHPSNADGNWWVDSNSAYNQVLEIDPQHWDARFQKARNMAFWPVAYGGQAEAVRHFETLVKQQRGSSDRADYADTYRWLGNLYDQQGRADDARRTWEQGLALFPNNASLRNKLNDATR